MTGSIWSSPATTNPAYTGYTPEQLNFAMYSPYANNLVASGHALTPPGSVAATLWQNAQNRLTDGSDLYAGVAQAIGVQNSLSTMGDSFAGYPPVPTLNEAHPTRASVEEGSHEKHHGRGHAWGHHKQKHHHPGHSRKD